MRSSSTRLDLRKAKVLLVDDNAQSLQLLAQILQGFRVEQARSCVSAQEGREALCSEAFDLIILDGEMPGEDGISLTRSVRWEKVNPNLTTPIIVVSGLTPAEKVLRARDAGANIMIKKPIAPAILLRRIEWLARNARDFITAPTYSGPDRRFRNLPLPPGIPERRADSLALTATPDAAMSQDEIDALFN